MTKYNPLWLVYHHAPGVDENYSSGTLQAIRSRKVFEGDYADMFAKAPTRVEVGSVQLQDITVALNKVSAGIARTSRRGIGNTYYIGQESKLPMETLTQYLNRSGIHNPDIRLLVDMSADQVWVAYEGRVEQPYGVDDNNVLLDRPYVYRPEEGEFYVHPNYEKYLGVLTIL